MIIALLLRFRMSDFADAMQRSTLAKALECQCVILSWLLRELQRFLALSRPVSDPLKLGICD